MSFETEYEDIDLKLWSISDNEKFTSHWRQGLEGGRTDFTYMIFYPEMVNLISRLIFSDGCFKLKDLSQVYFNFNSSVI